MRLLLRAKNCCFITLTIKHIGMKKMTYSVKINKDADSVYRMMLGLDDVQTYNNWTSAFNPTSTFNGSWEKGSRIFFVGTNAEGKQEGMVTDVMANDPAKFVSLRHIGVLKDGKEITSGPEVEGWAGCMEEYRFTEQDGVTTVSVDVDVNEPYLDYFNETYPKALDRLRDMAAA